MDKSSFGLLGVSPEFPLHARWVVSLFILWMITSTPSQAQFHIDSWTAENGLPQNVTLNACQTKNGYLWIATFDGLARFDGVRMVVFDRNNTAGILGNRFTSLYCRGDELWASSEASGVTRFRNRKFTTYTTQQDLPSNEVAGVTGDDSGRIWVLCKKSIYAWDEKTSRFSPLPAEPAIYGSAHPYFGFLGIYKGNLHVFANGRTLEYPLPSSWSKSGVQIAGTWDLHGDVWLASATRSVIHLIGNHWLTPQPNRRLSVIRDSRGQEWTETIGYAIGPRLTTSLQVRSSGRVMSIPFRSFFEDSEGSVWLTTDGDGLFRLRKEAVTMLSVQDGLPDRNIYPITQAKDGAVWIGAWNGELASYVNGSFKVFSAKEGLNSGPINSLLADREGRMWVGTQYDRLLRLHDQHFETVELPNALRDSIVRAMYESADGTIWFGTNHGLLWVNNDQWKKLQVSDGLAADDVHVITQSRDGTMWIGSYGGLTSIRDGHMKHWTEANGLPSNSVRALYEDADRVLWIGTYDGGLARFDGTRFTRYTVREGLYDNGVFQILEDSHGYLWMSCNRGIYRVAKSELADFAVGKRKTISSIAYGRRDGMRSEECNGGLSPAGIRASDGKMWFPTQNGIAIVDPNSVSLNPVPPPVEIESAAVDNKPHPLAGPIHISPGDENLAIEYTALSLIDSNLIHFKYKMQGLDRDWVEAGARRTAYYSHLPPGHYDFHVVAANSDGVWNNVGQSIQIVVKPPFFRTWWFLTVLALVLASATVLAWKYRVAQLNRANELHHAFSRELIASQERERKRIAAELHDSLGQHLVVIKNLALLSLSKGLDDHRSAPRIEEISAEASQALSEVREISYNLRPYQLDRIGLTKAVEAVVMRAAGATSIAFHSEIDPIDSLLDADSEINFYRIVQECVNNIVKHSQAENAEVAVRRSESILLLSIQDDGKGFATSEPTREGIQGGFGLLGIAERTKLLKGRAVTHSLPGRGTKVTIEIPINGKPHGS